MNILQMREIYIYIYIYMRQVRSDPPLVMVMVRGWGWGLASALSVVVGARGADFVPFCCFLGVVALILFMFACILLVFRSWRGCPSAPLWFWAPFRADRGPFLVDFFLKSPLESVILGPFL